MRQFFCLLPLRQFHLCPSSNVCFFAFAIRFCYFCCFVHIYLLSTLSIFWHYFTLIHRSSWSHLVFSVHKSPTTNEKHTVTMMISLQRMKTMTMTTMKKKKWAVHNPYSAFYVDKNRRVEINWSNQTHITNSLKWNREEKREKIDFWWSVDITDVTKWQCDYILLALKLYTAFGGFYSRDICFMSVPIAARKKANETKWEVNAKQS